MMGQGIIRMLNCRKVDSLSRARYGRTIRLLLSLIALQAGYGGMDFGFIKSRGREFDGYIKAIQMGMKDDFSALQGIIERALAGLPS